MKDKDLYNLWHKDELQAKIEMAKMLSNLLPKEEIEDVQERLFLSMCADVEKNVWVFLKTSLQTELWLNSEEAIKNCVDRICKKILDCKEPKSHKRFALKTIPLIQKICFASLEVSREE